MHRDAPENEKLVFKRSIPGLGTVMNRDVARVDCLPICQSGYRKQIKSCLRYGGARFVYVLNTNTALLNISFRSGGSSPSTVALYRL